MINVRLDVKKEVCFGCGACSNICKNGAIKMQMDEKGFFYPVFIPDLCTECELCEKVCPINNYQYQNEATYIYAVKNKSEVVRSQSASGGAFSAIAEYVLKNNGAVYAAKYTKDYSVEHVLIHNIEHLKFLRGSKYSQSNFHNNIPEVIRALSYKKIVAIVGTPCQIAAIKNLLKYVKHNAAVLLIDIVCHGVPSSKVFKLHIDLLEKKYGECAGYRTRSKLQGWHHYFERYKACNGKCYSKSELTQAYQVLFKSNLCLRESCYTCKYASTERVSDLTLGDFWGVEKVFPEWDDDKGISIILVNSALGEKIYDEIAVRFDAKQTTMQNVRQRHLYEPCSRPQNTDDFWNILLNEGYYFAYKKYGRLTLVGKIKRIILRGIFVFKYPRYKEEITSFAEEMTDTIRDEE